MSSKQFALLLASGNLEKDINRARYDRKRATKGKKNKRDVISKMVGGY